MAGAIPLGLERLVSLQHAVSAVHESAIIAGQEVLDNSRQEGAVWLRQWSPEPRLDFLDRGSHKRLLRGSGKKSAPAHRITVANGSRLPHASALGSREPGAQKSLPGQAAGPPRASLPG